MKKTTSPILVYIYLAIGCVVVGIVFIFLTILASLHFGIDLIKNFWLLAVPVLLSVFLNVLFIELYSKFKKK